MSHTERNFWASLGCFSQRYRAINNDRIVQSVVPVSKHFLSKAFIQLLRTQMITQYSSFYPILGVFLLCNPSCTERALKIYDFYLIAKL